VTNPLGVVVLQSGKHNAGARIWRRIMLRLPPRRLAEERCCQDLLHDGECDRVIRTLFNGSSSDLDVWEALCRDRNSYSLTIPLESNAEIALVSCRELTSKMLWTRRAVRSGRRDAELNEPSACTDGNAEKIKAGTHSRRSLAACDLERLGQNAMAI